MANKKPTEKSVHFPQNDCVVFGQLAPLPTRVHVSTSQEAPPKSDARSGAFSDGRK